MPRRRNRHAVEASPRIRPISLPPGGSPRKEPAGWIRRTTPWLAAALVAGVVAAVHEPALRAQALCFDDASYLTENPVVQNPSWAGAWRFLSEVSDPSTVEGYYQPLTMISLMIDHALGGTRDHLYVFHRTSLMLHSINTFLVVTLLRMLFAAPWVAALVGLIFGLHPMTVETIPWIGERKTLLAAFFSLLSLIVYVAHARRPRGWLWAGSTFAYLLALMSKPTATPLPVVMLLMDYWPLGRLNRRAVLEKAPLYLIGAASAVVTLISQGGSEAGTVLPDEYGSERIPLMLCHNIVFYLYKLIRLADYSAHYPIPDPFSIQHPMILAGVIGTCVLIGVLIWTWRRTRALLTGWLIFFVAIFPTMGVIGFTVVVASDKFAYLPSIGLLMVLCWAGVWWRERIRRLARPRVWAIVSVIVVLGWAVAEARATRAYLSRWQDTESLARHMLALAPDSAICHLHMGTALGLAGKPRQALMHYRRALEINPRFLQAHYNLGKLLTEEERFDKAIGVLQRAIKLKPDYAPVYNHLGMAYVRSGRADLAAEAFQEAVRLNPDYSPAQNNLGLMNAMHGRHAEAVRHFRAAVRGDPGNFRAHANLGDSLMRLGRVGEAKEHLRQAIEINPQYADAWMSLGDIARKSGDVPGAMRYYRGALEANPNLAIARRRIAELNAQPGG